MPSVKAITHLNQKVRLFHSALQRNLLPLCSEVIHLTATHLSLNGFSQPPV